jgi:glycosyltransferase involved in cell wall biosynthesis
MTPSPPIRSISAVIIAQNEADCIAQAVQSCLPFADEVVVVDGGSEDETVEIARQAGAVIYHNPWPGYAKQRNYGACEAKHDWIFVLDADEVVDDTLAASLNDWKRQPQLQARAFSINRIGDFLGVWLSSRPETHVRLYDRHRFHFPDVLVHEAVNVGNDRVIKLPGTVFHPGFRTISELVQRFNTYTDLDARKAHAEGKRFNLLRFLLKPPAKFVQMYIRNGMILQGKAGLFISSLWSYYILLKEIKLYEIDWATSRSSLMKRREKSVVSSR